MVKPCCSNFRVITAFFSDVQIFMRFTVYKINEEVFCMHQKYLPPFKYAAS